MRTRAITFLLFILCYPEIASTQILPGAPRSSYYFTFEGSNPLQALTDIDTTGSQIWQIGHTAKPYFVLPDTPSTAIMTQLGSAYPVNANNSFTLALPRGFNLIVTFKHKYQTDSGRDGGIVEFSNDSGVTWQNTLGSCNRDLSGWNEGIHTAGFYKKTDTLFNGEPGFSGVSNGWKTSSVQFFIALPLKGTANCGMTNVSLMRFRFLSDSIVNNFDGWLIDSIRVRQDEYSGGVNETNNEMLAMYPNPSIDGKFNFPVLNSEEHAGIVVTDLNGRVIISNKYSHLIDLKQYPAGVYFYRVASEQAAYRGWLIKY